MISVPISFFLPICATFSFWFWKFKTIPSQRNSRKDTMAQTKENLLLFDPNNTRPPSAVSCSPHLCLHSCGLLGALVLLDHSTAVLQLNSHFPTRHVLLLDLYPGLNSPTKFYLFVCLFVWDRVSLHIPGWPQTHDLPVSASPVLRLSVRHQVLRGWSVHCPPSFHWWHFSAFFPILSWSIIKARSVPLLMFLHVRIPVVSS
jgi:hypothetical protein